MSEMTLELAMAIMDTLLGTQGHCTYGQANAWTLIRAHLTRAPVQVTEDDVVRAMRVHDEHRKNGHPMYRAAAMRAALESLSARLAQPVDEGKQQWDELAAILGAHGDNVDEVFRKAREAMAQPVVPEVVLQNLAQIANGGKLSKNDMQDLASEAYNRLQRALLSQPHPQAAQTSVVDALNEAGRRYPEAANAICWLSGALAAQGGEAQVESWIGSTALVRVNPAQMVRIAKRFAAADQDHSYTQVDNFMPHDWVVAAMCAAYDAGRQNVIDGTHTEGFTHEALDRIAVTALQAYDDTKWDRGMPANGLTKMRAAMATVLRLNPREAHPAERAAVPEGMVLAPSAELNRLLTDVITACDFVGSRYRCRELSVRLSERVNTIRHAISAAPTLAGKEDTK